MSQFVFISVGGLNMNCLNYVLVSQLPNRSFSVNIVQLSVESLSGTGQTINLLLGRFLLVICLADALRFDSLAVVLRPIRFAGLRVNCAAPESNATASGRRNQFNMSRGNH